MPYVNVIVVSPPGRESRRSDATRRHSSRMRDHTMPNLVSWLIGLAMLAHMAFLYRADRRYPGRLKPRERTHYLTYCAWCIHRDGDL